MHPHVPADKVVRLRASLLAEETLETLGGCFKGELAMERAHAERTASYTQLDRTGLAAIDADELLDALLCDMGSLTVARKALDRLVERGEVEVDLVELTDGLADVMYVAEGAFLAFGIDSRPAHAEVQRSNMAKAGGPIREDGKRLRPPNWTAPDIRGVLIKQGMKA